MTPFAELMERYPTGDVQAALREAQGLPTAEVLPYMRERLGAAQQAREQEAARCVCSPPVPRRTDHRCCARGCEMLPEAVMDHFKRVYRLYVGEEYQP
jgi:hypothetical protein